MSSPSLAVSTLTAVVAAVAAASSVAVSAEVAVAEEAPAAEVAVVEDQLPHPASDTVVTVASKIDTSFFLII